MAGAVVVEGIGKQFSRIRRRSHRSAGAARWKQRSSRDHFWALKDVSVDVEPGQMLGIVGRNGAGKSTLLRIMGGVMRPDLGRVHVQGRVGGLLQLGSGFHGELTGRENIYTNGIIAGLTRKAVEHRLDAIIEFAELSEFIDYPLRTYSTGMRMRLAFSIAAHTDPDVLLIDEVLTVGDLAFQSKCLERIQTYRESGCAIVLVTHALAQVEQHCSSALWLRDGEVAASGPAGLVVEGYHSAMRAETRARMAHADRTVTAGDGAPLVMGQNRFGSLEVEITRTRLLDSSSVEVGAIESGESLEVEIRYHAVSPVNSPIVSVSISDEKNHEVISINSDADRVVLPAIAGDGIVSVKFDRLDLSAGAYFVNVGIHEGAWTYTFDYHWRVYPLQVRSHQRQSACLAPPHSWSIDTGSD